MSFGVLSLIVLSGLVGPLLGSSRRLVIPAVAGELLAGLVIGRSGFRLLDPDQATTVFLSNIGFAMLMFGAGMHVPVRRAALLPQPRRGGFAALITGALAVGAGVLASWIAHVGHPGLYAVVLGSGSAAVLVPCLDEFGLLGNRELLVVSAQVALADVASIVAVPLVLRPDKAADAALGILAVVAAGLLVLLTVRLVRRQAWVARLRRHSKEREWALDLRLSLLVLFVLCWVTVRTGASILIAGFAVGLLVAAAEGPRRLSRQVTGIGQGFFVPLVFVVLGAQIDVRDLVHRESLIALAVLLVVLDIAIHVVAASSTGQRIAAGLASTVQLGVPAAVVALGLQEHLIAAGTGPAIMVAALASIVISTTGVALIADRARREPAASSQAVGGATSP